MCIQDGLCPLYAASQEGHDKTVEILLQAGGTVDLQNKVESWYLLLLENGVHSNLSNFYGTSYILWNEDFYWQPHFYACVHVILIQHLVYLTNS